MINIYNKNARVNPLGRITDAAIGQTESLDRSPRRQA